MSLNIETSISNGISAHDSSHIPNRLYTQNENFSLAELGALCNQSSAKADFPLSSEIISNIPIYEHTKIDIADNFKLSKLQDEWHHILLSGPGAFIIRELYQDISVIDKAQSAFGSIIQIEQAAAHEDHFQPFGGSERIWNAFSKHAYTDPASFLEYYSNPVLALVCEAWLGPAYRITSVVNTVKPGGAAQDCHRDYHLGFKSAAECAAYPKAVQIASQLLTLQVAIAQTDMPAESGPTRLLPFSQKFEAGYMAYRLPEFQKYFLENYVSVPLKRGDAVFFNPALFHAAGENRMSDLSRSANLLQVSSAFGKPMEAIDTLPLIECTWNVLMKRYQYQGMSAEVNAFIQAVAEGYPFPTNLDRRPPRPGGLAPESEQDVLRRALIAGMDVDTLMSGLKQMRDASRAQVLR